MRTLMPQPAKVVARRGHLIPSSGQPAIKFARQKSERLARGVQRFAEHAKRLGCGGGLSITIDCAQAPVDWPQPDADETYRLTIDRGGIHIACQTEWGGLHALSTLTQLTSAQGLPCGEIEDAPRFAWRGLMIDVARHFIPAAVLERTIEAMALTKLNVLHLHLTDDQGFRFPSERFPALNQNQPHYSRAELKALVTLAADRGIRVIPELNMPGHCTCWLTAYPEWGLQPVTPTERFGVHAACLDISQPSVLAAVDELLDEVSAVFPDPMVHIGGDELNPAWWRDSAQMQAFMAANDFKDPPAAQAFFTRHVVARLESLGKRTIAWDEVLADSAPEGITVQAWRGATMRDKSIQSGRDCVYSSGYYLDLHYPAAVHYRTDPAAPQAMLVAQEDALLSEPTFAHAADGMRWTHAWRETRVPPAETSGRLLGAEACLWSELVSGDVLDERLWGRLPAVAERFWSPADVTDVPDMLRRLALVRHRLQAVAKVRLGYEPIIERFVLPAEWREVLETLEPVKWYSRLLGPVALAARLQGAEMPQARPYSTTTPLDRVIDFLPVDSAFAPELTRLLAEPAAGDRNQLRQVADRWQALGDLAPSAPEPALGEVVTLLPSLGRALASWLDGSPVAPADEAALRRATEPVGEYLIAAAFPLAAQIHVHD